MTTFPCQIFPESELTVGAFAGSRSAFQTRPAIMIQTGFGGDRHPLWLSVEDARSVVDLLQKLIVAVPE